MSQELKEALAPFAIAIQPHVPGDQMMELIGHTADEYRRALAAYEALSHLPDREEVEWLKGEFISAIFSLECEYGPRNDHPYDADRARAASICDRILSLMERRG